MAERNIDIGEEDVIFNVVSNAGTAGQTVVTQFLRPLATASLPAAPPLVTLAYDLTLNKLVVWTGAAYEAVTSV